MNATTRAFGFIFAIIVLGAVLLMRTSCSTTLTGRNGTRFQTYADASTLDVTLDGASMTATRLNHSTPTRAGWQCGGHDRQRRGCRNDGSGGGAMSERAYTIEEWEEVTRRERFARIAELEREVEKLNACLPLRTNRTHADARAMLGEILRHDDGPNCASHGCVSATQALQAVETLMVENTALRARIAEQDETIRLITVDPDYVGGVQHWIAKYDALMLKSMNATTELAKRIAELEEANGVLIDYSAELEQRAADSLKAFHSVEP